MALLMADRAFPTTADAADAAVAKVAVLVGSAPRGNPGSARPSASRDRRHAFASASEQFRVPGRPPRTVPCDQRRLARCTSVTHRAHDVWGYQARLYFVYSLAVLTARLSEASGCWTTSTRGFGRGGCDEGCTGLHPVRGKLVGRLVWPGMGARVKNVPRLVPVVLSLLLAVGCAAGPDYKRPKVALPSGYRFETGPRPPRRSSTFHGGGSSATTRFARWWKRRSATTSTFSWRPPVSTPHALKPRPPARSSCPA